MDNINLADYVAIFWVADTADTGHIRWVRADQPHPHYAMYVFRFQALSLKRYYDRLVEKQGQHRFDMPLRIIAECGAHVDAATASTASLVPVDVDDDDIELVMCDIDPNAPPLFREPVGNAMIAMSNIDFDVYSRLSLFLTEVNAVMWRGEP